MRTLIHCCALLALPALAGCETSTLPDDSAGRAEQAAAAHKPHGDLKFVQGYERGYDRAIQEGKPMLVFFTAEWCHYCHQMADEAFTNAQVVRLAERFVCILVDADAEPRVCEQFEVDGFPTIQFLSPQGSRLNRVVGKQPGHQVLMSMQAALQNVAHRQSSGTEPVVR